MDINQEQIAAAGITRRDEHHHPLPRGIFADVVKLLRSYAQFLQFYGCEKFMLFLVDWLLRVRETDFDLLGKGGKRANDVGCIN